MAEAAFNKRKTLFTSILDLALRKELVKCCILSVDLYGADALTLRKVYQKYLESFEIWCWRRTSWTDRVRKEEVLNRVKEEWNVLHTINRKKAYWSGRMLHRNCLLKYVIEGRIEGKGRRGRRRKRLLDDLKETGEYWKLKHEAIDRAHFGRGCGPVVRPTTWWWGKDGHRSDKLLNIPEIQDFKFWTLLPEETETFWHWRFFVEKKNLPFCMDAKMGLSP